MRVRNKTLMGRIGENGELNLHWDALKEFLSSHKGKVAIVRVELMAVEPTEKTRNYFFGYIIPELKNAFMENGEHLTKEETYNKIRGLCPLFIREDRVEGKWKRRIVEFEELDQAECNEIIDWTIQWAAENLFFVLDPPVQEKTL
jgi:hypothetical protein